MCYMTFSFIIAYKICDSAQHMTEHSYLEYDISFASGLMRIVMHLLEVNTDIQGLLTVHSLQGWLQ